MTHLEHHDFVRRYQSGDLRIQVHRQLAWKAANSSEFPKRPRFAHYFWSWVWMLSVPASFATMYFYKWWAGLLALLVVPATILKANRTGVMQGVIRHVIADPAYYIHALTTGLIRVEPAASTSTAGPDLKS